MSTLTVKDIDKDKLGELTLQIKEQSAILLENDAAFVTKGNKQAAKRARVASLNLSKAAKKYREVSMSIFNPQTA